MASKPNPSWSEPQKKVHKQVLEALDVAIPFFGPEIVVLDNHTDESLCDNVGIIKCARKAFDEVEKQLTARFKARLGSRTEMRGTRFEASNATSERTALDQTKVGLLLGAADAIGLDLYKLMQWVDAGKPFDFPEAFKLNPDDVASNEGRFFKTTPVSTLRVTEIA